MNGTSGLLAHVLRQGDRALVLAQRLGEWVAHAPELEEDMAVANLSLDLLGQARHLYSYAGELEGQGHEEDYFAYWRSADQFGNPLLVEQPNGDFAHTMVRQLLHDHAALLYWESMTVSTDSRLAALAVRASNETRFHLRHSHGWVVRLGDGTEESHRRTQNALTALWPYAEELVTCPDDDELRETGQVGPPFADAWRTAVAETLAEATLIIPDGAVPITGGWSGTHTEHLVPLLDELQSVARAHPGASW